MHPPSSRFFRLVAGPVPSEAKQASPGTTLRAWGAREREEERAETEALWPGKTERD